MSHDESCFNNQSDETGGRDHGGLGIRADDPPPGITEASPSLSFVLRIPLLGLSDRVDLSRKVRRGQSLTLPNRRNAPRARLGPPELSSHGSQQLQQRRGRHPDLHRLLAALSVLPLLHTPQGRRGWSLPGITSILTTTSITVFNHSRPWSRHWKRFHRPGYTANPLTTPPKCRIFGQSQICL